MKNRIKYLIIGLLIVFSNLNLLSYDWIIFQNIENSSFFSIDAFDSLNYCIACRYNTTSGGNFEIYNFISESNDGGNTWKIIWKSNDSKKIKKAIFLSKDIIVAGVEGGLIIRTSDRGVNWDTTNFNIDPTLDCKALSFYDKKHGAAFFIKQPVIVLSDDSGKTWYNLEKPQIEDFSIGYNIDDIIRFDDSIIIMTYYRFEDDTHWIIRTENKGKSWEYYMESDNYFTNFYFYNDKIGWMGGLKNFKNEPIPLIKKTTNGGVSWELSYLADYQNTGFHSIEVLDEDNVIAINGGYIIRTTDCGASWFYETYQDTSNLAFSDIAFGSKELGLIAARYNFILTNSKITGIPVNGSNLHSTPIIYPNPIKQNQQLNIIFNLENNLSLKIDLIDILGRKVTDLYEGCNENRENILQLSINERQLLGLYWIRLIINDNEQIVRPIVIIE